MKVWIGHLVSPIRPNLQPHPSLSGQQTLQHSTGCTSTQHYNVPRRRCCIIEGDSIATFGQVRRSQTFATPSSAKWQINNAPDPWSQLSPKVFLSFIHQAPFPSSALCSVAAFNKSCSLWSEGDSNWEHFFFVS